MLSNQSIAETASEFRGILERGRETAPTQHVLGATLSLAATATFHEARPSLVGPAPKVSNDPKLGVTAANVVETPRTLVDTTPEIRSNTNVIEITPRSGPSPPHMKPQLLRAWSKPPQGTSPVVSRLEQSRSRPPAEAITNLIEPALEWGKGLGCGLQSKQPT